MNNFLGQVSLKRPNNNTPYTPGSVIGNVVGGRTDERSSQLFLLNFSGLVDRLGPILVSVLSAQAILPALELWLFRQPIKEQADNTPWAPTGNDLMGLLKVVTFSAYHGQGIRVLQSQADEFPIITTRVVFGVLVVRNAYRPIPKEEFVISALGVGEPGTPIGNGKGFTYSVPLGE